jgi:hypothetical protein
MEIPIEQDRRTGQRLKMALPVKLWSLKSEWGEPFTEEVTTVNVSARGATLRGVRQNHRVGDVVVVEYKTSRATFEVVWVGRKDSSDDGDIGVRCLELRKFIWGTPPSQTEEGGSARTDEARSTATATSPPSLVVQSERRRHVRFAYSGKLEILSDRTEAFTTAKLRDISSRGCFVEINPPPALGSQTQLLFQAGGGDIRAQGVVRFVSKGHGVGIEFTEMGRDDQIQLEGLIKLLASGRSLLPELDSQGLRVGKPDETGESEKPAQLSADVNLKVESVRRWSNRRRSERAMLRFPIVVSGEAGLARPFSEDTETLVVSSYGALITMNIPVELEQSLVLWRRRCPRFRWRWAAV